METQMQAGSQSQTQLPQDERIWAALAHGSAFFVFFGPIIPVIVWFTQRKKSAYLAFQALQAMLYQSLFFWTWVLLIPLLMIVVVVIIIFSGILLAQDQNNEVLVALLPQILIWGTMIGTFLLYAGIGVWGAVASLTGRDFRYPFFGGRLARHLDYHGPQTASLLADKEDQVVGAVCHSTSVLLVFGIATPLLVWITQHERSMLLRFQALQALVYQAIGLIGYFAFTLLNFVFVFGSMGLALLSSEPNPSSAMPVWLGVATVTLIAFSCVFLLAALVYPVLAFVAVVRVLKGHDFHYPVLGRILAARLKPKEAT